MVALPAHATVCHPSPLSPADAAEPSGASGEPAAPAAAGVPKRERKLQRLFLDMEAELRWGLGGAISYFNVKGGRFTQIPVHTYRSLHGNLFSMPLCQPKACQLAQPSTALLGHRPRLCSDEEGAEGASDDEPDDDLDDQGELVRTCCLCHSDPGCCLAVPQLVHLAGIVLPSQTCFAKRLWTQKCTDTLPWQPAHPAAAPPQADLIGQAKETGKDRKMRRLLHQQWVQQQDDKELQQVGWTGGAAGLVGEAGGGWYGR